MKDLKKKDLTKEEIIKKITNKEIYDIDYDFAVKAADNIKFTQCHRYSTYHYKTILAILKSKLATISDKDDKLAYLNCLSVNYTSLSNTDIFDVIISILTGGFIGVSFIDKSNDIIYKIAAIIFIIAFLCIKTYALTTRKWSFYDKLFEHLKNGIE